jgi:hypothetical protein
MMELLLANLKKAEASRKADHEDLLARLETDREERKAEGKAFQEELKEMMEGVLRDKQDA